MPVTSRKAVLEDDAFLYELYCSTRNEEVAAWGWGAAQRETFLRLQFLAQRRHYELAYEGADHRIVVVDDRPVGRMLVYRSEREFVLVDIALLPDVRGTGLGTALIGDLLEEADRARKPVGLHVEKSNRARQLYERLGFEVVKDTGVYFKMERKPPGEKEMGECWRA